MYKLLVLVSVIAFAFAGSDTDGACGSAPCQNNGLCKNGRITKNYYCACPFGFYGRNCEKQVKRKCEYAPDLCENGGTCVNKKFFDYYCDCRPGYTGTNCENTPCDSNPCQNGGRCKNKNGDDGGFKCKCADGWQGKLCHVESPPLNHDCEENNPCARENTLKNGFYFQHEDKTKFVQCSEWEQCFIMSCGPGTEWNQDKVTCDWPQG